MKKYLILLTFIIVGFYSNAQEKVYVHQSNNTPVEMLVSEIDSIYFSSDSSTIYFRLGSILNQYPVNMVDSITFSLNTVYITYNGSTVTIINPLSTSGVNISVTNGTDVIVTSTSTTQDINYNISGTTSDGLLKVYSDKRFNLILNGVNITNPTGPAINIQSDKRVLVNLVDGTLNSLTDGLNYFDPVPITEDQKAAFFSEGQLIFNGNGTLNITGLGTDKHALCSDDYIEIYEGTIKVISALKDGIHSNSGFLIDNGNLNLTATGDGIDVEAGRILINGGSITTTNSSSDVSAIKCDSTLTINGGNLNITVNGNQSKGLKSNQEMQLNGGKITINTSGATVLTASGSGYAPSYCTAIKCDSNIFINGSKIFITSTGNGGKGISTDKSIYINGDSVSITTSGGAATYTNPSGIADSYSSCGISADEDISILNGYVYTSSTGIAGKGISADKNLTFGNNDNGPVVKVTTTGVRLLVSGTSGSATAFYTNPKAIKSNGVFTVNKGTITVITSQPGGEGFDSDSNLIINGGTINITISGNQTKGIKSSAAMMLNDGNINVTTTGGVVLETYGSGKSPSYCGAIKSSKTIEIAGVTITTSGTGAASKGITADGNITMINGNVTVSCTGTGTTYTNSSGTTDSYNSTCLGSDGRISIIGGSFTSTTATTAAGGKAISSNGSIFIGDNNNSPTINITTTGSKFVVSGTNYCHPKTIVTDSNVTINNGTITIASSDDGIHAEKIYTQNGGSVTINNSYEGVEGFNIIVNNGYLYIVASNDGINGTAGLVSGGTEQNDNSLVSFTGGTVVSNATNGDAIDCNGNITMTGGIVIANGPQTGAEEACDFNGSFNMNGGFFIGSGSNSNMSKAMSTTSTQPNMFIKSSSVISSSTLFHIQNATGLDLVTFKPKYGGYYFLFSSSALTQGASYSIYTGGSYTGGTVSDGYYTGGTYTAGTLKKTVTLSTTSKVNTITF